MDQPHFGQPRTAGQPGTFLSIQALRGIAAILVVIFHAGLRYDSTEMTFRVGNAGVDIFFVISGFVMWTVTARRPTAPLTFLQQRVIRLVPLYWFFTVVAAAAWALRPAAFPHMHPNLRHFLLSLAFVPHVSPDTGTIVPLLGQGWTLNYEMFFYVLFAITLLAPLRARFATIAGTLAALTAIGFAVLTPQIPVTTLLSPLLIEFLGGIVLARLVLAGVRPAVPLCWAVIAAGAILLCFAAPPADDDLQRLLQYGGPAFLIVGGAVFAELSGGLSIGRLPRFVGDASYSIYLSHTFVIAGLGKVWGAAPHPWYFITVATLLAVPVGGAVYLLLERPLLALLRRRRVPRQSGADRPRTGSAVPAFPGPAAIRAERGFAGGTALSRPDQT